MAELLAGGANPDVSASRFQGPVIVDAARGGRLDLVQLLMSAGASIGPSGHFSVTPLRVAMLEGRTEVVRHLLAHGALAMETTKRTSILTEAVSCTRHRPGPAAVDTLRVLLEAGATPHPAEEALLITGVVGPVPPVVLRLLLAHGADPDQKRSDGTPAIVIAARHGDDAAVDTLVEAGADVNAGDHQGRTALMHAVERNERRVIATLLTAGAATGTVSADGMTALRLARGWQRQNVQFMLGERQVGLDSVPIERTFVRIIPAAARLAGDPRMLHLLASAIDIALEDLGDDEWDTRTGVDAGTARAVALRLRDEITPAAHGSWYELPVTADELAAPRSALVELAYGTTRAMPEGVDRWAITDLLVELNRQLGR